MIARPHHQRASHRPGALDYDGISHARLTRRMTQARLPPTARVIMAEVFRAIPVGRWGRLSHATLARRLLLSESTVSRGMALLVDAGFVDRCPCADGPGYEICPLPPPELRPRPAAAKPAESPAPAPDGASFTPSISDPVGSIPPELIRTPQSGASEGSMVDGRIFYDQTCSSSMQAALPEDTKPDKPLTTDQAVAPPTGNDLPPAPPPDLAPLFLPHQWRRIREVAPAGYGLPDLVEATIRLRRRTDVKWPWKLLVAALERGELIYTQEELDARDAELRALAGQSAGPLRSPASPAPRPRPVDTAPPEAPDEDTDEENPAIVARRILGADAPNPDVFFVAQRLFAGASPEEAIAALRADLAARGLPPPTYGRLLGGG